MVIYGKAKRKEIKMKQLIVLISTVILGIAISTMVLGFRTPVATMGDNAGDQLDAIAGVLAEEPVADKAGSGSGTGGGGDVTP